MHRHWWLINLGLLALALVLTGEDIHRWLSGSASDWAAICSYPLAPLLFVVFAAALLLTVAAAILRMLRKP